LTQEVLTQPLTEPAAGHAGGEHVEGHAAPHASHDGHNSPEQIRKETRVYLMVLGALAVLTGMTVGVIKIGHVPESWAIAVALTIASIKGFLVAGFFMHLLSEKKLIYAILILTVVFFIVLMLLPLSTVNGRLTY
jgi:cytochrome c oxidase subunit 4